LLFLASLIKKAGDDLLSFALQAGRKFYKYSISLFFGIKEFLFVPQVLYNAEVLIAYPFYPRE
jgi:hypothetical protein